MRLADLPIRTVINLTDEEKEPKTIITTTPKEKKPRKRLPITQADKDRIAAWKRANKEKVLAQQRRHYAKHRKSKNPPPPDRGRVTQYNIKVFAFSNGQRIHPIFLTDRQKYGPKGKHI